MNRNDLTEHFGVSTPQASLDIARYKALAPDNLIYDGSSKTYTVGPGFRLLTAGGPAAAERIASAAPAARVVKAFNLCHEDVWRLTPPSFDGRPLAVPLCGDDEPALNVVRRLVRDLGCEPLAAGGLDRAGLVEATAALLIGLWVGEGADAQAIAPPLEFAGGRGRD